MPDFLSPFREKIVFLNPEYLFLLRICAGFFVVWFAIFLWKRWRRPEKTVGSSYPVVGQIKFWFFLIISGSLIVLALSRPVSERDVVFRRGAVGVIVVIDNSLSARAQDVSSRGITRLDVAKREIIRLVGEDIIQEGDRVGLFVFGKISLVPWPPSTDLQGFVRDVNRVRFSKSLFDQTIWGTDFGIMLQHMYEMLDKMEEFEKIDDFEFFPEGMKKIAIIFTDGGDEVGDSRLIDHSLLELRERGVKVYAVGIGTREGVSWLSLVEGYEEGKDYERGSTDGWEGKTARLEVELLEKIAHSTGGRVFTIEDENTTASEFLVDVINENKNLLSVSTKENAFEWWRILVFVSLLVFLIAILLY